MNTILVNVSVALFFPSFFFVRFETTNIPVKVLLFVGHRMRMNRRTGGNEQVLEEFNNAQSEQLAEKVKLIKGLSQQIKLDIESSDLLIRDVDREMTGAEGLIMETLRRLSTVTENENSRHMLYLCLFIVTIFLALYFLM